MANHTATVSVHATLTATKVDAVTLKAVNRGAGGGLGITVVNRTGTKAIYFTVSASAVGPGDPSIGGSNTYVVPAAITSVRVSVSPGVAQNPVVVKLISTGAEAYSVEAL